MPCWQPWQTVVVPGASVAFSWELVMTRLDANSPFQAIQQGSHHARSFVQNRQSKAVPCKYLFKTLALVDPGFHVVFPSVQLKKCNQQHIWRSQVCGAFPADLVAGGRPGWKMGQETLPTPTFCPSIIRLGATLFGSRSRWTET